jgi:hypothetical protein
VVQYSRLMFLILWLFARIAASPKMAPTIAKMVITMAITQPVESKAIQAATQRNEKIFIAYIAVLLGTAILIAVFTWLTWDSGNKVQDAIQADSNARIEEAKSTAATANERAKRIEQDNLVLRGQVATLEIDASKAKTQLEAERIRRIELERAVLRRSIPGYDQASLIPLRRFSPIDFTVWYTPGEPEFLASQVASFPQNAGWKFIGFKRTEPGGLADGVTVVGSGRAKDAAEFLAESIRQHGVEASFSSSSPPGLPLGTVGILIGSMPDPFRR